MHAAWISNDSRNATNVMQLWLIHDWLLFYCRPYCLIILWPQLLMCLRLCTTEGCSCTRLPTLMTRRRCSSVFVQGLKPQWVLTCVSWESWRINAAVTFIKRPYINSVLWKWRNQSDPARIEPRTFWILVRVSYIPTELLEPHADWGALINIKLS